MWASLFLFLLLLSLFWVFQLHSQLEKATRQCDSERKRSNELTKKLHHIRDSEETRRTSLFNSMVEGVLIVDSGNKVQLVNPAFESLFGVQKDVRGATVMEALQMHEIQDLVEEARTKGVVRGFELELPYLKDRFLEINVAVFQNRQGEHEGMILVFHDLTRLKQLEATRKEFVANVSHELRTPLSLIKGFVETLIDGAQTDPSVLDKFLRTISKHADRLTFLIEDLLTISKLESGQIVMNYQAESLLGISRRVVDDLQSRLKEKSVILENRIAQNILVKADAARVQQVFFNLVDNAVKYGRQGGLIFLDASLTDQGTVQVSVKNEGPGIPADAQQRIFERFYRLDQARSREQGGTGLGLSIVKHIVQSHGGEVWVESSASTGTCFYFTLRTP